MRKQVASGKLQVAAQTEIIPFHGKELVAIAKDDDYYVALKPLCDALGIDWEPQRRRTERHVILNAATAKMVATGSDGKNYDMLCLPIRKVNGWLYGISLSQLSDMNTREKVAKYIAECDDVLFEHFFNRSIPQEKLLEIECFMNEYDRLSNDLKLLKMQTAQAELEHLLRTSKKLDLRKLRKIIAIRESGLLNRHEVARAFSVTKEVIDKCMKLYRHSKGDFRDHRPRQLLPAKTAKHSALMKVQKETPDAGFGRSVNTSNA